MREKKRGKERERKRESVLVCAYERKAGRKGEQENVCKRNVREKYINYCVVRTEL